jgi:DNA (cytosine-5)-methyltransferase 1
MNRRRKLSLRIVDLFAGGGGFSLGFTNAGYDVVAAFDNWQPAYEFYKANFPKHPIIKTDLSSVDAINKIQGFSPDIIIGGPPCQDFSSAGKRDEKLGRADLTITFANIIQKVNPRFFVMENVARAEQSNAFMHACAIFKRAGYGLSIKVVNASLCGVPQLRKRLFVIGQKDGADGFLNTLIEQRLADKPMTIREYFKDGLDFEHYYRHPRSYKRRGVFSVDEPSPTIRGVNRPVPAGYTGHSGDTLAVTMDVRPLTTRERSMIQTFPPKTILWGNKTDVEQIIGNAVPVKLAEYIALRLKEYIIASGIIENRQT